MSGLRVDLVYDRGCPNVAAARAALRRGFALAGRPPAWREWDRHSPDCPEEMRRYGSPTILVDGRDVDPMPAPAAASCRLYDDNGRPARAPAPARVARALAAAQGQPAASAGADPGVEAVWHGGAPALVGLGAALAPTCPACWPVYSAMLGAAGLGFVMEEAVLLPLAAGLLALTLLLLARGARARRGYGPFWLGVAAAGVLAVSKLVFDWDPGAYAGLGLLIAASAWNAWPGRPRACPARIGPAEAAAGAKAKQD